MDAIVINTRPKRKPVIRARKRNRNTAFVWIMVIGYLSSVAVAAVVSELLVRQIYGYSLIEVLFGKQS